MSNIAETGPKCKAKLSVEEFKVKLKHWTANFRSPADLRKLPELVHDLTTTCPRSGEGVHYWLPKAAWLLAHWPFKLSFQKICPILEKTMLDHGRKPQKDEIANAVNFVLDTGQEYKSKRRRAPAPRLDKRLAKEASTQGGAEAEAVLRGQSQIKEPQRMLTYEVLCRHFAEGVNLSFNHNIHHGNVYRLGPKFAQFFSNGRKIPQWMVPHAVTQRTSHSHRALNDFSHWDYQVTEFDSGSRQEKASKILWLEERSIAPPLVMVVWSAGKSLQAWWDVRAVASERRLAFFNLAVRVGADPAHKTINQLVRTPNAMRRENNQEQEVIYLI